MFCFRINITGFFFLGCQLAKLFLFSLQSVTIELLPKQYDANSISRIKYKKDKTYLLL